MSEQTMSEQTLKAVRPAAFSAVETKGEPSTESAADAVLPAALLIGATIALVCVMFWTHAFGSPTCHIRPAQFVFGTNSVIAADIPAGVPCIVAIRPGSASVEALAIDVEPKFGTLSPRGRTGVIFRPHAKANGPDEFAFSVYGPGGADQKSVIRVLTNPK